MREHPVFFDPHGKRGRIAGAIVTALVLLGVSLVATLLFVGTFAAPRLPRLSAEHRATELADSRAIGQTPHSLATLRLRNELAREIVHGNRKAAPKNSSTIALGFYATWETAGLDSLKAHAGALTHLAPQWLHLAPVGAKDPIDYHEFDLEKNPRNVDVIRTANANGVNIVPILDDYGASKFESARARKLLLDPSAQDRVADELTAFIRKNKFAGLNLDLEDLDEASGRALIGFAGRLRKRFQPYGLSLSADVESGNENVDFGKLADECDFVVPMVYDEHSQDMKAGPIASIGWSQDVLSRVLDKVDASKIVLGIGGFAYDWVDGKAGAQSMPFQEAMTEASGYRSEPAEKVIRFDEDSMNTTFAYRDDSDKLHEVWLLDAISAYNQVRLAANAHLRGAALWALGSEDPATWSFFDHRRLLKPDPNGVQSIRYAYELSFTGRGEILQVRGRPKQGRRDIEVDPDTKLITDCRTVSYASPYVVEKSGYLPKKVALTFDDGPDPQWTPQILDILKREHAPATFFDIGSNVEEYPSIANREVLDGHEVGSHSFTHPNMGEVADRRAKLEINLTQMAIEGATGRSTVLFRPPYNADSQPSTTEQLKPVLLADDMGYVTVGENIDTEDWDLEVPLPDGGTRPKTADDIVSAVIDGLQRRNTGDDEGNIVLMHDAGGDRSQTVAALSRLIPMLRAKGYELVPVSRLMHKTANDVMPAISAKDRMYFALGRWGLGAAFALRDGLAVLFRVAIVLGLCRVALIVPLAIAEWRRKKNLPLATGTVSVVIAAYNEAAVIARTVGSVLASRYPVEEVIVVDDGSTDGTTTALQAAFPDEPRLRILTKTNGGKASALNYGIQLAHGDLLFHIDADTILDSEAIGNLARHFHDVEVAAVAGNVTVGNEVNLLTRWQALEYITSQNLDRRAYARLNCITVVPGAIGMWRRSLVVSLGGYQTDTLAEDTDLTWRLRREGFRIENDPQAFAYTEAPERAGPFIRQRFRWSYGTLQCLWKHRGALGRNGWFGRLALPTQWLFGVIFQSLAPLVDIQVVIALLAFAVDLLSPSGESRTYAVGTDSANLTQVLVMYVLFLAADLAAGAVALRMEGRPLGRLVWLIPQRLIYRQLMVLVMIKSVAHAVAGRAAGWGKLARTGNVQIAAEPTA